MARKFIEPSVARPRESPTKVPQSAPRRRSRWPIGEIFSMASLAMDKSNSLSTAWAKRYSRRAAFQQLFATLRFSWICQQDYPWVIENFYRREDCYHTWWFFMTKFSHSSKSTSISSTGSFFAFWNDNEETSYMFNWVSPSRIALKFIFPEPSNYKVWDHIHEMKQINQTGSPDQDLKISLGTRASIKQASISHKLFRRCGSCIHLQQHDV